jgi:ABC-type uncharacterized transport system permease subunit
MKGESKSLLNATMTPVDALPSVAEIAITLGGFIGLIVVFKPVSAASWSDEERSRIAFVLILCMLILLCGLLPFALGGLRLSDEIIWGVPLFIFGTGNLFLIVNMLIRLHTKRVRIHFPLISWPILSAWLVLDITLLLSSLGILWPYSSGLLLLGLLGNLMIGAITLTALMAQSISRDDD